MTECNHRTVAANKWHHNSVKARRKRLSLGPSPANSFFLVTLFLLLPRIKSFVIAPPWANPDVNQCSRSSWQLIHWPEDGKCYPIFSQGPCPRTQELGFNQATMRAECKCPKHLLYWPAADRCYEQFSRGPCEVNQYLVQMDDKMASTLKLVQLQGGGGQTSFNQNVAMCKNTEICANGWIFWPPMQQCYQLYTQGPCHKVAPPSLICSLLERSNIKPFYFRVTC